MGEKREESEDASGPFVCSASPRLEAYEGGCQARVSSWKILGAFCVFLFSFPLIIEVFLKFFYKSDVS